ncbi:MAG: class I SAM-dependent methyltransferase [Candidatus Sulfotelmatobacter sp.]
MTTLKSLQQDWEWLGENDPLWAVCTDPSRSDRRWNQQEFFATGEAEVNTVLDLLQSLGYTPSRKERALDFGCGAGRLTRALSLHFDQCCGIDISFSMIAAAKRLNHDRTNCQFLVNRSEKLVDQPDRSYGFIYSSIVLQHLRPRLVISYLQEFARLLSGGGVLVFQMPSHRNAFLGQLRSALHLKSRIRRLRQAVGQIDSDPRSKMEMNCLRAGPIHQVLNSSGCEVADVRLTNSCDPGFNGNLRYLEAEPISSYVSKQYVALKVG